MYQFQLKLTTGETGWATSLPLVLWSASSIQVTLIRNGASGLLAFGS